jgi:hypothetical protein
MRALLAVLLIALSAAAQAELKKGDVLVSYAGMVASGVYVFDSAGNKKTEFVPYPQPAPALERAGLFFTTKPIRTRAGEYLVGEQYTSFPRVARYDESGDHVTLYWLPSEPAMRGVRSLELLADQCTLAWVPIFYDNAAMYLDSSRLSVIRKFDICANKPAGDVLLTPAPGGLLKSVRQLANGDFLVATGLEAGRFDAKGNLVRWYPRVLYDFIVGMALTPDGSGFWLVDRARLIRFDFASPQQPAVNVVAVVSYNPSEPISAQELSVAGEWRAALQPPPPPGPRRRAVPH